MSRPLISVLFSAVFYLLAPFAFAAPDYVWWEAEDATKHNFPEKNNPFDPHGAEQTAKISKGKWLNVGGKGRTVDHFAEYEVNLPKADEYFFYVRKFYYHGPFKFKFNNNPFIEITRKVHPPLLGSVDLRLHLGADWIQLGPYKLPKGKNSLRIELLSRDGAAAFDCFVLTPTPFEPLGLRKPGERLGTKNKNRFAFEAPYDTFEKKGLWDLSYLNEDVAGESGYVRRSKDGNDFVLGNGNPVRFWAINTYNQRNPDINETKKHAKFLAKRGFNMVRFHGHIQSNTDNVFDVNQKNIEESWRLVAAMKEEGIYTTISPYWGTHVKRNKKWTNVPGSNEKNFASLVFFEPTVQKAYKGWLKKWLTPKNPHTGIPLAKDPAVAIFQIQNEDSMLFWTQKQVQGPARRILEKQFTAWATKKYGSAQKAMVAWGNEKQKEDKNGVFGLYQIWELTQKRSGGKHKRITDQYTFYVETMANWNTEVQRYLREELGCKALINAGNWKTADQVTMLDGERVAYSVNQVMGVNRYTNGGVHINPKQSWRTGYAISLGDWFEDKSNLFKPRHIPVNLKMVEGYPMIISESTWVSPMNHQTEGPFLVSAYSSLNGMDIYYWFATGATFFNNGASKFPAGTPDMMATYPAAALLYRQAYLKQGEKVIDEHRSLDEIYQRATPIISEEAGFDPNRDKGLSYKLSNIKGGVNPLAFLVGPVVTNYDSDPKKTKVTDVSPYIKGNTVMSNTGELSLDSKTGLCTMNAPKAQGVTGFLKKAGSVKLKDVTITSNNEYATVFVVALDNKPLSSSSKVLVQVTTQGRPDGWHQVPKTFNNPHNKRDKSRYQGYEVKNLGQPPVTFVNHDVTVALKNSKLKKATFTDENGYAAKSAAFSGSLKVPSNTIYTVLTP